MHHAETPPEQLQTPPGPAAVPAQASHDQIAAIHSNGVLVQETGAAQGGQELPRFPGRWRPDELTRPVMFSVTDEEADAIQVHRRFPDQARGDELLRLRKRDGMASRG